MGVVEAFGEFRPSDPDCYPPEECRQDYPYHDRHHIFYERNQYQTRIERDFRNLGENIIRICRCKHTEIHNNLEPPEKPPTDYMVEQLEASEQHMPCGLRKAIMEHRRA